MMTILQKVVATSGATPASAETAPRRLTDKIRVVVVDDDDGFREMVRGGLADNGFEVTAFADGTSLLRHLADGASADVVILDWKMPAMSGIDLLGRMRNQGAAMPTIFLTGMPERSFEAAALDQGAVDFVDKSRGTDILTKRIKLAVEAEGVRLRPVPSEDIHRGRLLLRAKVGRAYWDGIDVNLTVTEYNIVRMLAASAGEHATYRALYDCVHRVGFIAGAGDNGYRTNVRSAMRRIRDKFRAVDANFDEIENYPSFGYRWKAPPVIAGDQPA